MPLPTNVGGPGGALGAISAAGLPLLDRATTGVKDILALVSTSEADFFDEDRYSEGEIRRLLNDSNPEKKLGAMKRVMAAHSMGRDVSRVFPDVVKNISVGHLELKKLVHMYLVLHAEKNRDLALLSINSFQRDLVARNHVVRASALRAMASIRLLEIVQLVVLAVKKASTDSSPYCRKVAAQCTNKVFDTDPDQLPLLRDILLSLMTDVEVSVVGSAVVSFSQICVYKAPRSVIRDSPAAVSSEPLTAGAESGDAALANRVAHGAGNETLPGSLGEGAGPAGQIASADLEPLSDGVTGSSLRVPSPGKTITENLALLHPVYRSLVAKLPFLEPFTQPAAVDLLSRYCRTFFADLRRNHTESSPQRNGDGASGNTIPLDLAKFFTALQKLLRSGSTAVVTASATALFYLAPEKTYWSSFVHPLLRCLSRRDAADTTEPLLRLLVPIVSSCPNLFVAHMKMFCVRGNDPSAVKKLKLQVLETFWVFVLCGAPEPARGAEPEGAGRGGVSPTKAGALSTTSAPPRNAAACLSFALTELNSYLYWAGDADFTSSVVACLTRLALRVPEATEAVVKCLVKPLDSDSPQLAAEGVVAIRTLMQQQKKTDSLAPLVAQLTGYLQRVRAPAARASVVWVVGTYQHEIAYLAPDVLRVLVKGFSSEAEEVKAQILALALKVWSYHFYNRLGVSPRTSETDLSCPLNERREKRADEESNAGAESFGSDVSQAPSWQESDEIFERLDALVGYLWEVAYFDQAIDMRDVSRFYEGLVRDAREALRIFESEISEATRRRVDMGQQQPPMPMPLLRSGFQSLFMSDSSRPELPDGGGDLSDLVIRWAAQSPYSAFCLRFVRWLSLSLSERAKWKTRDCATARDSPFPFSATSNLRDDGMLAGTSVSTLLSALEEGRKRQHREQGGFTPVVPSASTAGQTEPRWLLSSLSHYLDEPVDGYFPLGPFAVSNSPESLRDTTSAPGASHDLPAGPTLSGLVKRGQAVKSISSASFSQEARTKSNAAAAGMPQSRTAQDLESFYAGSDSPRLGISPGRGEALQAPDGAGAFGLCSSATKWLSGKFGLFRHLLVRSREGCCSPVFTWFRETRRSSVIAGAFYFSKSVKKLSAGCVFSGFYSWLVALLGLRIALAFLICNVVARESCVLATPSFIALASGNGFLLLCVRRCRRWRLPGGIGPICVGRIGRRSTSEPRRERPSDSFPWASHSRYKRVCCSCRHCGWAAGRHCRRGRG